MTDPDRLDALEMRIAHQDRIIEDLNAAVTAQWKIIDRLTRDLATLAEYASSNAFAGVRAPGDEPPPPHY